MSILSKGRECNDASEEVKPTDARPKESITEIRKYVEEVDVVEEPLLFLSALSFCFPLLKI